MARTAARTTRTSATSKISSIFPKESETYCLLVPFHSIYINCVNQAVTVDLKQQDLSLVDGGKGKYIQAWIFNEFNT
jgi:hypothetical protein